MPKTDKLLIEELRKEIAALRREVERLRNRPAPYVPPQHVPELPPMNPPQPPYRPHFYMEGGLKGRIGPKHPLDPNP